MTRIQRLVWVLPHPTPYNVYLLNELGDGLGVPSEAVYRWPSLPNHPWSKLPERRFQFREIANAGGRDSALEQLCATDEQALVVFAGWRDGTILPALIRRWRRGYPYAFWSDTPKVGGNPLRIALNRSQLFFIRRSAALLATGSPAIRNYLRIGVAPEKLKNFPFVVDPAHFAKAVHARDGRNTSAAVTFVLPARLIDKLKGQRVAIEALARAKAATSANIRLVLAGTGPDEKMLRDAARNLGVAEAVEFRGWVEYDAMPSVLGEADALVLPSHWDPFPVAVIEAMAAGLPVLGSNACGSVIERVSKGENGFVHAAGNSAQLSEHMRQIAESSDLRRRLGANALRTSREWSVDQNVSALKSVLGEVEKQARTVG